MKLDQRDTVEVIPAGDGTALARLHRLPFFGESNDALGAFYGVPAAAKVARLKLAIANPVETGTGGLGEEPGYRHVVRFEPPDKVIDADFVDHFERTLDPVVTKLHCIVDTDRVFPDLGDQRGRVAQAARQDAPGIATMQAVILQQLVDPFALGQFG